MRLGGPEAKNLGLDTAEGRAFNEQYYGGKQSSENPTEAPLLSPEGKSFIERTLDNEEEQKFYDYLHRKGIDDDKDPDYDKALKEYLKTLPPARYPAERKNNKKERVIGPKGS